MHVVEAKHLIIWITVPKTGIGVNIPHSASQKLQNFRKA